MVMNFATRQGELFKNRRKDKEKLIDKVHVGLKSDNLKSQSFGHFKEKGKVQEEQGKFSVISEGLDLDDVSNGQRSDEEDIGLTHHNMKILGRSSGIATGIKRKDIRNGMLLEELSQKWPFTTKHRQRLEVSSLECFGRFNVLSFNYAFSILGSSSVLIVVLVFIISLVSSKGWFLQVSAMVFSCWIASSFVIV